MKVSLIRMIGCKSSEICSLKRILTFQEVFQQRKFTKFFSSMELNSSYQEKIKILRSSTLQWNEAIEANLVQCDRVEIDELGKTLTEKEQLARCANPTLGDFLVNRDSFVSEVIQTDDGPRLSPLTKTKINRLNLIDQLMHTVASPPITYLLLISGLALLLFEFFLLHYYSTMLKLKSFYMHFYHF